MKKTGKKIMALALVGSFLAPSVGHASDVNSLINEIYDGMDSINEATGRGKVDRPNLPSSSTTTTTTTTTTVVSSSKAKEEAKEAKIQELKMKLAEQDIAIRAAEDILANYPKTIKGKERKLLEVLTRAYELRLKAAAAIKNLTGEEVKVRSLNIPAEYRGLMSTI